MDEVQLTMLTLAWDQFLGPFVGHRVIVDVPGFSHVHGKLQHFMLCHEGFDDGNIAIKSADGTGFVPLRFKITKAPKITHTGDQVIIDFSPAHSLIIR